MSARTVRFINATMRTLARSANQRGQHVLAPFLFAAGLLAASLFALIAGADQTRASRSADPAAVVESYIAAVNAGDLQGVLDLYADDAVHIALPTADGSAGVCLGKAQFSMWYTQSVADGDRIEIEKDTLAVDGNRVTFVARLTSDPWRELGLETLEANAEAVVVDGRIATHVVMLTPDSVRELLTARGTISDQMTEDALAQVAMPHAMEGAR